MPTPAPTPATEPWLPSAMYWLAGNRRAQLVLLCILLGQCLLAGMAAHRGAWYWDDSWQYLHLASQIIKGLPYSQDTALPWVADLQRPPGYPVFLALAGGLPWVAVVAQHLLLWGSALLLWRAVGWQLGVGRAWRVAVLYLAMPYTWLYANLLLTENLFIFLTLLALVLAGCYWQNGQIRYLAGAAVVCVATAYVKGLGVVLLPGVFIVFARKRWYSQVRQPHHWLPWLLPLLLMGPWFHHNWQAAGTLAWTTNNQTATLYGRNMAALALANGQATDDATLFYLGDSLGLARLQLDQPVMRYQQQHPSQETALLTQEGMALQSELAEETALHLMLVKTRALVQMLAGAGYRTTLQQTGWQPIAMLAAMVNIVLMLLALLAALSKTRNLLRWPPLLWAAAWTAACYLLLHAAIWADGRYRLPADPLLFMMGAAGLDRLLGRANGWLARR